MWSEDPFFKKRASSSLYPASASYLEDLHRTYGPKLPERNQEAFARAKQFRDHEKRQIQAMSEHYEELNIDHERLVTENTQYQRAITSSTAMINALSKRLATISKERQDGTPTDRGDDGTECGRLPPAQEPDDGPPGGVPLRVQPQVLPTDVPDPGGPSAEHSDAGRPISDDGVSEQPTGGRVPTE